MTVVISGGDQSAALAQVFVQTQGWLSSGAGLPLRAEELALLHTLITARLVMVVAISGWRAARYPENAAYLLRNNAVSWARLAACERIGHAVVTRAFQQACSGA